MQLAARHYRLLKVDRSRLDPIIGKTIRVETAHGNDALQRYTVEEMLIVVPRQCVRIKPYKCVSNILINEVT